MLSVETGFGGTVRPVCLKSEMHEIHRPTTKFGETLNEWDATNSTKPTFFNS